MLIATYTSFLQSHSQVRAVVLHDDFSAHPPLQPHPTPPLPTPPHPVSQMLLMLQREAELVEEMRAAAAEFRQVPRLAALPFT
jgi:hypothetical protein